MANYYKSVNGNGKTVVDYRWKSSCKEYQHYLLSKIFNRGKKWLLVALNTPVSSQCRVFWKMTE